MNVLLLTSFFYLLPTTILLYFHPQHKLLARSYLLLLFVPSNSPSLFSPSWIILWDTPSPSVLNNGKSSDLCPTSLTISNFFFQYPKWSRHLNPTTSWMVFYIPMDSAVTCVQTHSGQIPGLTFLIDSNFAPAGVYRCHVPKRENIILNILKIKNIKIICRWQNQFWWKTKSTCSEYSTYAFNWTFLSWCGFSLTST